MAVAMDNVILENILRQVRPLIGQGKVADYIPALATVDGSRTGLPFVPLMGSFFRPETRKNVFPFNLFPKCSVSLSLCVITPKRRSGNASAKDPSGSPFNSTVQLEMEQGIPRNPFINAGALVVCDMLQGRLSARGSVCWKWCAA